MGYAVLYRDVYLRGAPTPQKYRGDKKHLGVFEVTSSCVAVPQAHRGDLQDKRPRCGYFDVSRPAAAPCSPSTF